MTKPKFFRSYEIERDENGMPTKMIWTGDHEITEKPSRIDIDVQRLREWEQLYGPSREADNEPQ